MYIVAEKFFKFLSFIVFFLKCIFNRYVPAHLHLMVFELVKNSLRAVQERYMDSDKVAPPIRIIVADGEEDVTIKVFCFHILISTITNFWPFVLDVLLRQHEIASLR